MGARVGLGSVPVRMNAWMLRLFLVSTGYGVEGSVMFMLCIRRPVLSVCKESSLTGSIV